MTVDVELNLKAYRGGLNPEARYASFDYCFNHFQGAREAGGTHRLADGDHLQLSCLQLGFYLASWGMMRGSGDLLQRSVRGLAPVVELIAREPASTWNLDAHSYTDAADEVLDLSNRVRKGFKVSGIKASDTLVTKTMLGVFGCVPAFDRYFQIAFGRATLTERTLKKLTVFYERNQAEIDAAQVFTLEFNTGRVTGRCYSRAKIIDMVFFQEGLKRS